MVAWLIPIWIAIGIASLAIAYIPIRRLHRLFGQSLGAVEYVPTASGSQQRRAELIGRTIRIAAMGAPFRADCFPTALVGVLMCRLCRIPAALHLGVCLPDASDDPPLAAHAWVVSGRVGITGGRGNFRRYTTLGCWSVAA